ncbi:MAG TPA: hypothetical protein DD827_03510 [Gammaproteobacteria bacterium]|jgi:hypothetical protein|nr:hypothetical protein [Gammaproteobacteria bacterium]
MHGFSSQITFARTFTKKRATKEIMRFEEAPYKELVSTVGQLPPETGGLLFGSRDDYVVKRFHYDTSGSRSGASYDPDPDVLNPIIQRIWEEEGLALIGWAHSHPRGVRRLSGDYGNGVGDLGYLRAIFNALPNLEKFLVPILYSTNNGKLEIMPYVAYRDNVKDYREAKLKIKHAPQKPAFAKKALDAKIDKSVNPQLIANTKIFAVGCGGANNIYENVFRLGLGHLSVMDFDTVDDSNLVTQGWYADQIGKPKVEALADTFSRLVPFKHDLKRRLTCLNEDFLALDDQTLIEQAGDADLLMFMTDNFWAQARGNRLALKLQKPAIFAMMYERAQCCEVSFIIPGVTPSCHRCAVSNRYKAYLEEGYENDVGSEGSLIFQTHLLNSIIGELALAILHRDLPEYEHGAWFDKNKGRNFLQTRLNPKYDDPYFTKIFGNEPRAVCFDSIWQNIEPECPPKYKSCPDCSGSGDLTKAVIDSTMVKLPQA